MTVKGMTLFSGFGGADLGMQGAGIKVIAGIEYDDRIAEVARSNGLAVTTADVTQVNPADYIGIEALHASPPCPNFSVAKAGAKETPHDLALAGAVCRFIEVLKPRYFTLENVQAYAKSQSWRMIENTLYGCGYLPDVQIMNSADYGVPQTRRRMIVRAIRGEMVPNMPPAGRWIGWYEAIEDLIPTLPESQFAPWQLERLPEEMRNYLVSSTHADEGLAPSESLPAWTLVASEKTVSPRAFLVNTREWHGSADALYTTDGGIQPAYAMAATSTGDRHKAFLVGGANTSTEQAAPGVGVSDSGEPVFVVNGSNSNQWKAFLVDGKLNDNSASLTTRNGETRSFTVTTSHNNRDVKGWLSAGRVVKMTPRALARFQSFPDSYQLPQNNALACKGIGNAVPPLLMKAVWESMGVQS